jgi:chemotaxis protein methyltransferase CheR
MVYQRIMSDMKNNQNEININSLSATYKLQMPDSVFNRLSQFIYSQYGIKMPPAKKIMLQSRLQKRLRELNMNSYEQYCDFVFSKDGEAMELVHMIDVVTTNKTDFYREPTHFDFLSQTILPEFVAREKNRAPLKIWSAGCSSGEEVYTISIVISDFIEKHRGPDYSIFGTDISSSILTKAVNAIYTEERASNIPLETKKKYFLRSKDRDKPTVRLIPEIRKKASFQRLNFMDENYNINDTFDIIFCRNVLIYFDRDTQQKVINRLCGNLRTGGYFFLGHSESITGMKVPLVQLKPTIFMKV